MTQEEKIEKLKRWLDHNKVAYDEPDREGSGYVAIFVRKMRIVVFVCPPEKEEFCYSLAMQGNRRAFFVRDSEDMGFIFEKMRNCLHGMLLKYLQPAKPKRKHIHITTKKNIRHDKIKY